MKYLAAFFTILTLGLALAVPQTLQAQDDDDKGKATVPGKQTKEKAFDISRISVGGDLGASFGNNFTFVEVSPILGYAFNDKLMMGGGPVYRFVNYKLFGFKYNLTGGRVFARRLILSEIFRSTDIFVQGGYDYNRYKDNFDQTANINRLPLGGVLGQRVGRSYIYATALYDLLYDTTDPVRSSVYNTPWNFNFGVNIGL